MFTGIVDHVGKIAKRDGGTAEGRLRLVIDTSFTDLVPGESISVDGVCLTVVEPEAGRFGCELSMETLQKTVAGEYEPGSGVNLERAMRLSDRVGGHLVSGHVDGTARVSAIEPQSEFVKVSFSGLSREFRSLLVPKGSVAIQGTSLTVNELTEDGFDVTLIPHTLERTNLSSLRVGQFVNIEFDGMVKILKQQVEETVRRILQDDRPL